MLQIITGRFFTTADFHRTPQSTVLYSNFSALSPIETVVGSYTPAGSSYDVEAGVYAVEQRLEATAPDGSPSVLVAVAPENLAQDFAALMSFCLEITCALDSPLVGRLTQSTRPPIGVPSRPAAIIPKVFERQLYPPDVDVALLPSFIADLVRLERARYLATIKAIRRYIVGLHRIGDDLPLAYTMLVASIESLAQDFDAFTPEWRDLDEAKRSKIDSSLRGADPEVREAVRQAVLDIEHVALARRYREFALAHLPASFYREESVDREGPARASELPDALSRAYGLRSQLIHRLQDLPGMLVHSPLRRDIIYVDGKPTLTFSGLARVARRVILRFVEVGPRPERESYDYRRHLPGVVTVPMAPKYWIWRAANYHTRSARRFLSGFLTQLEAVLLGQEKGLTDLGSVLEVIERTVPGVAMHNRRPMVALYLLYHRHLVGADHRPNAAAFLAAHVGVLDAPSIESLICHVVLSQPTGWNPGEQETQRRAYLKQRYHRDGLRAGPVLETALILHTAETFEAAGDVETAAALLSQAVEDVPGNAALLELESRRRAGEAVCLDWRQILLKQSQSGLPA